MRKGASQFIVHFVAWVLLVILPMLFMAGQPGTTGWLHVVQSGHFWLFTALYLFIFYLNLLVLLPGLFLKGQAGWYVAAVLLLFVALYFLQPFDRLMTGFNNLPAGAGPGGIPQPGPPPGIPGNNGPNGPGPRQAPSVDIVAIFLGMVAISIGLAATLLQQWKTTAVRLARTETEKLNAELAFLKARVNPHFLFNTLNNIYALVEQKSDRAGESILRLSSIMRYVTDEVLADRVPLEQETGCIDDFIALQQLRLNPKTTVQFTCTGQLAAHTIAPLILVPFVENAFKYGVSNHEAGTITIEVHGHEGGIRFGCRNRIMHTLRNSARTGTGIENVRQRLAYLYPGRHKLTINDQNGTFEVQLVLQDK